MFRIALRFIGGLAALGVFNAPAAAQTSSPGGAEGAPTLSMWGTGEPMGAYHNISADCETFVHAFGRNAAWGRWSMPRTAVALEVVTSETDADLVFRCRDGSACITRRQSEERTLSEHRVRFTTRDRADSVAGHLNAMEDRCAAASVGSAGSASATE